MKMRGIKMKNKAFIIAMICLTIICISPIFIGQWLIQRQADSAPTYQEPQACSCCFPTTANFTNVKQAPIDENVTDIYGNDDFETYDEKGNVTKAGIAFTDIKLTFANTQGFKDSDGQTVLFVYGDFKVPSSTGATNISFRNEMLWKWAGTYTFKIVDNVTGQVICPNHTYTISQARVDLSGFELDRTYAFVGDAPVTYQVEWTSTGSWKGSSPQIAVPIEDRSSATPTYTQEIKYSPTADIAQTVYGSTADYYISLARNNFAEPTSSGEITVIATTQVVSGSTTTYYGSITSALGGVEGVDGATSGTIYPLQSVTYGGNTYSATAGTAGRYTHIITANCTIKSGITVAIPVNGLSTTILTDNNLVQMEASNYYVKGSANAANTSNSTVAYDDPNKKYEKNTVFIASGVTLTNNGTIMLPALISGGSGGGKVNSMVCGDYSRIALEAGAKINNATANSTIYCFGFIDNGETGNNASQVTISKGKLYTVFTVSEHRGGSIYLGMTDVSEEGILSGLYAPDVPLAGILGLKDPNKIYYPGVEVFPFNRFYIQSVSVRLVTKYDASVYGHAVLAADNSNNIANMELIGSAITNLIQLTTTGSRVECDFDGFDESTRTEETTLADIESSKKLTVEIYGDATIHSISLRLEVTKTVSGMTATMRCVLSSGSTFFPISHHLDIYLKPPTNEQGSITGTSTVTSQQDLKILPGGSITVEEGVTFNASNMAVYQDSSLLQPTDGSTALGLPYPTNKEAGALTVNGHLSVSSLGGEVVTNNQYATISITSSASVVVKELTSTTDSPLTVSIGISFTVPRKQGTFSSQTLKANGIATTIYNESPSSQYLDSATTVPYYFSSYHMGEIAWHPTVIKLNLNASGQTFSNGQEQIEINLPIDMNGVTNWQNVNNNLPKHSDSSYSISGWTTEEGSNTEMDMGELAKTLKLSGYTLFAVWEKIPSIAITYTGNTLTQSDVLFGETSTRIVGGEFTILASAGSNYCDNINYEEYLTGWKLSSLMIDGTELITTDSLSITYSSSLGLISSQKLLSDAGYNGDASTIANASATFAPIWAKKHTIVLSALSGANPFASVTIEGKETVMALDQKVYAKPTDSVAIQAYATGHSEKILIWTYWRAATVSIQNNNKSAWSVSDTQESQKAMVTASTNEVQRGSGGTMNSVTGAKLELTSGGTTVIKVSGS